VRGMLDVYDLVIERTKQEIKKEREKNKMEVLAPVYVYKNDLRILTAAGHISKIYMGIYRLSDYKNAKTDIEVGASLKSCIERLAFTDIKGECFSLAGLEG